ncbi:acyl-CoA synthetase [Elstera litoralis]|uniref:Acyl-CoA synthetase n=1 Tax=Elstera litoralis TaxID=552518 RepID=A0A0F3IVI6_9PROT|nr:AMP-binding protein [Elstera litoralis]KJV10553.1 acyl-CoA synthetase [Elstera litoralis]
MLHIDDIFFSEAEFRARVGHAAEAIGLGSRARGRYAVCFPETIDWLSLFFALKEADCTVLPLHPSTPLAAARRMAQEAGCHALFFHRLTPELLPDPGAPETAGHLLQMSSGTTGAPKIIARSWGEIAGEIASYTGHFRAPEAMTPVIACPTTHSYGLICGLLVALHRGQVPVILNVDNPKYLLKRLRDIERPLLYSSPVILHTLAKLLPEDAPLHALMSSGTVLPDPWFAAIRRKTRHMFQQYGCSEAGCIAINGDVQASNDMGIVLPHHRLEAGAGAYAPAEIILRREGGDIFTRDLGYLKSDGSLVFVARLDDTINVSGLNVYPQQVEDVVMGFPGVTDAIVFRKADAFAGERVGLVFTATEAVSLQSLRAWCRSHLAAHQQPSEIRQTASLPRKANGKISRREVAELYQSGALLPLEAAQ